MPINPIPEPTPQARFYAALAQTVALIRRHGIIVSYLVSALLLLAVLATTGYSHSLIAIVFFGLGSIAIGIPVLLRGKP